MSPELNPHVRVARELASTLLAPDAQRVDVQGVDPATLAVLGHAGLLGLAGPRSHGGQQAPAAVERAVTEALAGADGATWFVTTQHKLPMVTLAASGNTPLRERWLRPLCTGGGLAGVAVAHLRRPGSPAVTATRHEGGWRLDGHVAWMTSWGLADVFLLAALTPQGEAVFALVPARDQPGLVSSPPLRLAAMAATGTVTLDLTAYDVSDADVVDVTDAVPWLEADRIKTANVTPAVFGLHAEVVRRLRATADRRGDATATELADRLQAEGDGVRAAAYALMDEVPAHEQLAERLALRAHALELVGRAATALVVATGGSAMGLDAAPQRLVREAAFHLVQAQTAPVREATLRRLLARTA